MLEVSYLAPQLPPDQNYSGRLIAAGVILLLLAACAGCLTAVMPVGYAAQMRYGQTHATLPALPPTTQFNGQTVQLAPPPKAVPVSAFVLGMVLYGSVAVACGWLGIAAIRKRRYVRPLLLIFGVQGMILGGLSFLTMAATLPVIIERVQQSGNGGAAIGVVTGISVAFGGALFIALPAALFFLMRNDSVRVTAEHFDVRPRWTDGIPLQTLGLVVTLMVFAGFELLVLPSPMVPVFWFFITGIPAGVLVLAHAAALAWAGVRVYRRDGFGWTLGAWAMIVPSVVFTVSTITMPADRYYDAMREQPEAVEMIQGHETLFRTTWIVVTLLTLAATVVYLRRVRPYVEIRPALPLQ